MTERELIERYRRAYKAENGQHGYSITYQRGWFVFRPLPHGLHFRKRKREVEAMCDVLERRAALRALEEQGGK